MMFIDDLSIMKKLFRLSIIGCHPALLHVSINSQDPINICTNVLIPWQIQNTTAIAIAIFVAASASALCVVPCPACKDSRDPIASR